MNKEENLTFGGRSLVDEVNHVYQRLDVYYLYYVFDVYYFLCPWMFLVNLFICYDINGEVTFLWMFRCKRKDSLTNG